MPFINIPTYGSASWKDAVADPASLPASGNEVGDARVTESTSEIYVWDGSAWQNVGGSASAITALTNDVTATGPGSVAATVAFVGGETAADVATSVQDTQAATDLSTVSTIVKRDASGETSLDGLNLDGSVSGAINIKAADTTAGYTIKMPAAQGGATTYLENDGSGNLSWVTVSAGMTNPMTTQGDLITGGAAGAPQRLGLGTTEYVLAAGATDPYWTIEGIKTGYPTDTVILGRTKPTGLTGVGNVIVNTTSSNSLTTGYENTCIGTNSGNALTTANNNVLIGHDAGKAITTAPYCVAIGQNALGSFTTIGSGGKEGMVAVGYLSLQSFNGTRAVAVGVNSLRSVTSSNAITAIGYNVGIFANNCNDCTFVGNQAGYRFQAARNTAVGSDAAFTAGNLTGTDNIYLGAFTQPLANNTTKSISLGNYAKAGSNEFAVGSANADIQTVLLGRGGESQTVANAVKIQTMRSSGTDTDMSVGTLTIAGAQGTGTGAGGDVIIATAPPDVASGSSLNAHFEVMRITDDGLVGIQTSTPNDPLTVQGAINYTDGTSDYKISPAHYDEGTETTNFTIDWSNSPVQTVTLNGTTNATVTLNNPLQGGAYVLRIIQGATPGTIDFTAGGFADAVWPGGTAPTLSGSTGDVDIINLLYIDDGGGTVTYYGTFATDFS